MSSDFVTCDAGRPDQQVVVRGGPVTAPVLHLDEPLSFWGGVDAATGQIIDARHPQRGDTVAGQIVTMPSGRGSSSAAGVIVELVRNGVGPAAFVLAEPDDIVTLGAIVADELYGIAPPVIISAAAAQLPTGRVVSIDHDGLQLLDSSPSAPVD